MWKKSLWKKKHLRWKSTGPRAQKSEVTPKAEVMLATEMENVEEIALEEKTSPVEVNGSESAEVRSNPEGRSNAGNGNGECGRNRFGRKNISGGSQRVRERRSP